MRRNTTGERYFINRPGAPKPAHHVPIEPQDICSVVNEYVREAYKAGFEEIRLIHGRGNGTQRGTVQATLERHPLVDTFRDAPESHLGATIATLRGT